MPSALNFVRSRNANSSLSHSAPTSTQPRCVSLFSTAHVALISLSVRAVWSASRGFEDSSLPLMHMAQRCRTWRSTISTLYAHGFRVQIAARPLARRLSLRCLAELFPDPFRKGDASTPRSGFLGSLFDVRGILHLVLANARCDQRS